MLDNININSAQIQAAAKSAQTQMAALQAKYAGAAPGVIADLNSGNYAQAFKDAAAANSGVTDNAANTNPLMLDLETSGGLQQLDPSLQWNQQNMQDYYQAAMGYAPGTAPNSGTWNAATTLGQNPYGGGLQWGSNEPGAIASDATTNYTTQGDNSAPDLARFAAQNPPVSFGKKWGAPIAGAIAAILAPYATPAIAAGLAGAGVASGVGATVAAGALYGAGTGAVEGAIGGGNIGQDALFGGLGGAATGALSGSGVTGAASNSLSNYTGLSPALSAGVVKGGIGAGIGTASSALTGGDVANGALIGGGAGAISGAVGSAADSPGLGSVAGTIAGGLIGKYGTSPSTPSTPSSAIATPAATPTIAPAAATQAATDAAQSAEAGMGQANIGNYTGYGYAPRAQTNPTITDTYGQGPEAQFFRNTGAPSGNTIATLPSTVSSNTGLSNSGFTPTNSKTIQPVTVGPTSI